MAPRGDPLELLLASVRRRLRLRALRAGAAKGLRFAAALTVVLAATHLLLRPLATSSSLMAAACLWLGTSAVCALRARPTADAAARAADHWLFAEDLFTSAADQLAKPTDRRPGAAGLVVERARTRAAEFLEQPREPVGPLPGGEVWGLGGLILAGALALRLPGGLLPAVITAGHGEEARALSSSSAQPEDPGVALKTALASAARLPAALEPTGRVAARSDELGAAGSRQSGGDSRLPGAEALRERLASGASAGTTGAISGGKSATSGPGRASEAGLGRASKAPAEILPPVRSVQVRFVEIPAGGQSGLTGRRVGTGDGPATEEARRAALPPDRGQPAEAAGAEPTPYLAPVLRQYAARYFELARNANDEP